MGRNVFKPRRANEKRKINEVVLSFRKFALRGFLLLPRRARLAFLQLVTKWIIEKLLSVPCQDIGQGHIQGTNVLFLHDLVRGEPLNPLKAKTLFVVGRIINITAFRFIKREVQTAVIGFCIFLTCTCINHFFISDFFVWL